MPSARLAVLATFLFIAPALSSEPVVSGVVESLDGDPIAGAEVRLIAPSGAADQARSLLRPQPAAALALTGVDGRYELVAPSVGVWRILVSAPGFVSSRFELTPLIEDRVLPSARLQEDRRLRVRVRGDDAPVEGALVRLAAAADRRTRWRSEAWTTPAQHALTDAQGVAELPRAAGSASVLSISAASYAIYEEERITGGVVDATLSRAPGLSLRVLDDSGSPVSGALVRAGKLRHPIGLTDGEGRLATSLDGGRRLRVLLEGPRASSIRTTVSAAVDEGPREVVLTLPRPIWAEGRLIDGLTRSPIPGGVVWIEGGPSEASVTDEDGGFRLPIDDGGRLQAGARGYLESRGLELRQRATEATLALMPGASVAGRVVDGNGEPIAGAAVKLEVKRRAGGDVRIEFGRQGPAPETVSDAEGRFHIGPVDPGENWRLTASAEGMARGSVDVGVLEPYERREGLQLALERGLRAGGRVTDADGSPLSGASVAFSPARARRGLHFMPAEGKDEAVSAVTGGDGRYEIAGLATGRFDIEVRRRGFASKTVPGFEIADATTSVPTIALEPGAAVDGWVVDEAGRPIEGAEIRVSRGEMTFVMPGGSVGDPDARSGADGYFRIDDLARDAKIDLAVERTGYTAVRERGVDVAMGEPLEIALAPASSLFGTVLDAEGVGIAGAEIELTRSVSMRMGGNMMMMKSLERATAEADGSFRFDGLEPGKVSLKASAPGMQTSSRSDIEVPRGEDVGGIEIPLEPGSVVLGQVFLSDSRPAIGARVREVSEDEGPMRMGGAVTDGDGRFALDGLTPGVVSIEATMEDGNRAVREIELREGLNELDLRFSGGAPVRGRVVDGSGSPIGGAWVQLVPASRPWGGPEIVSRDDGAFEFEGVRRGSYRVRAAADGYAAPLEPPGIQVGEQGVLDAEIVLRQGGAIEGRVVGIAEAEYPKLSIAAYSRAGEGNASAAVDHEGRFVLEDLAPGPWTVVARIGLDGRRSEARARVDGPGSVAEVVLEFVEGISLEGRATQARRPITEAIVNLVGRDVDAFGWSKTDGEGHFRIAGLERGTYDLELRQWSTGLTYREIVELTAQREIEIEVPTVSVSGTIVDALDREPLPGVRVTLEPASAGGEETASLGGHGTTTDLDGRFRLSHVTDGPWTLRARRKGYAAASEPIIIQGGRDRDDVALALEPTEGLVIDVGFAAGGVPDQVRLAVLDGSGASLLTGNHATGEKGRIRLSSVPPGPWLVILGTSGTATSQVDVTAPGPPVAVLLAPATELEVLIPELVDAATLATVTLVDDAGREHRSLGWLGDPVSSWRVAGGRARIGNLPPGTWTVRARTADGREWTKTATTIPGGEETVVLE